MISKEKLNFDPTDANSLAASDTVGSYTLAGDGTSIGHVSDALKVNFTNSSLAVTQSTSPWVIGDGGGSITVDAVALDIRHLTFANDKVDASGSSVSISGTVAVTQSTSPWVTSRNWSLDHTTDNVFSWTKDGAGNAITSTADGGKRALDVHIAGSDIEINVDDRANTSLKSSAYSATNSSGDILAGSPLASRKFLWVQNLGASAVYLGDSTVTTSNGIRFSNGAIGEFRFGPALALYAVTSAGTADVRILQAS